MAFGAGGLMLVAMELWKAASGGQSGIQFT